MFLLMASVTLLFTIMRPNGQGTAECIVALILLFFYPQRLFGNLHGASKNIFYLMIPADNRDKIWTNFFLVNIYAVLGLALSIFIGYSIGYLILKYGFESGIYLPDFMQRYAFENPVRSLFILYATLSIFFFGSVYFKKRAVLSTLGMGIVALFGMTFLISLTLWINVRLIIHTNSLMVDSDVLYSDEVQSWVVMLSCMLVMAFFYILSFIRFRETEA